MSGFLDFFRGKTVLVTGHTGFKGSWLAFWLHRLGARVVGYALDPPTTPSLFAGLQLETLVEHHHGDIRDPGHLEKVVAAANPDAVFHLAAQPLVRDSYEVPVATWDTNVMGTIHVLESLRRLTKPCPAVFITTDKCYENREWVYGYRECDPLGGHDPYSSSKAGAEIAISAWRRSFFRGHPVKIASVRAGNVIGGGDWAKDRIVPDCIRALQRKQPIVVRNRRSTRPWQHVLEPLGGYLWLAARLGSHSPTTVAPDAETAGPGTAAQSVSPKGAGPARPGATAGPGTAPGPSGAVGPTASRFPSPAPSPATDGEGLDGAFNFGPLRESNRPVEALVTEILRHWPGSWEDRTDPRAVHEAGLLHLSIDKAQVALGWHPVYDFAVTIRETVAWYAGANRDNRPEALRELTAGQLDTYVAAARSQGLAWATPAATSTTGHP